MRTRILAALAVALLAAPSWAQINDGAIYYRPSPNALTGPVTITTGPITLSSGQFLHPAGTSAAPSGSFASDPDTGFYNGSANAFDIVAGGAYVTRFQGTTIKMFYDAACIRMGASEETALCRLGNYTLGVKSSTATAQNVMQVWGGYGSYTEQGELHEAMTLSLVGATTDSTANLLPANAHIEAVAWRITTGVTGAGVTSLTIGDATDADRFASGVTLALGDSGVGRLAADQTGTAGPIQTTAAKLRITAVGATPTAGAVRVIVYYRLWAVPSS